MDRVFKSGLILVFCFSIILQARAQDTAKKVERLPSSEVKVPAAKPVHHIHKSVPPVVLPNANPVVKPGDTAQANALKAQMDPAQLNDKSLNGQYQYLLSKTYHYQQPLLAALWKNAMDTLAAGRNLLKDAQAKFAAQKKLADSLKSTASTTAQSLTESNAKADAISVFGMTVSKSNYNLVMFGLVAGLGIVLTIVIVTTAKHKHEAKYRSMLYDELDEEFKTFKAKAHEKELKLARELQTERNKLDDLLNKDGK
ncbi:MAG: hypothetical protein JSU01_18920 [Bacteroidetes bacterium]|nr:hypothetical protein [Bacteroidota bacterium]